MDVFSSINLPHWLMIAGTILVTMGFLGLVFNRNRQTATNPDSGPTVARSQMPPLPSLLDSSRRRAANDRASHTPASRSGEGKK
jgi:hypothetical protein